MTYDCMILRKAEYRRTMCNISNMLAGFYTSSLCLASVTVNVQWARTWYTPVTEKRPTLDPVVCSDMALVLVETWKRPIVVGPLAGPAERDEAPLTASFGDTPFDKEDDR